MRKENPQRISLPSEDMQSLVCFLIATWSNHLQDIWSFLGYTVDEHLRAEGGAEGGAESITVMCSPQEEEYTKSFGGSNGEGSGVCEKEINGVPAGILAAWIQTAATHLWA